jgi:hypothetical protein
MLPYDVISCLVQTWPTAKDGDVDDWIPFHLAPCIANALVEVIPFIWPIELTTVNIYIYIYIYIYNNDNNNNNGDRYRAAVGMWFHRSTAHSHILEIIGSGT